MLAWTTSDRIGIHVAADPFRQHDVIDMLAVSRPASSRYAGQMSASRATRLPQFTLLLLLLLGPGSLGCRAIAGYDTRGSVDAGAQDVYIGDTRPRRDSLGDQGGPIPCTDGTSCPGRSCAAVDCQNGVCVYFPLEMQPALICRQAMGPCDEPERCGGGLLDCPPVTVHRGGPILASRACGGGFLDHFDRLRKGIDKAISAWLHVVCAGPGDTQRGARARGSAAA
jgi:hypothetical protein